MLPPNGLNCPLMIMIKIRLNDGGASEGPRNGSENANCEVCNDSVVFVYFLVV